MNGIINVYKEKGMTSHDVIHKLRKILGLKKIGHAGTLDPEAEGVLIVGVGNGTRVLEYIGDGYKVYQGEVVFGIESDTEDIHGSLKEVDYLEESLDEYKLRDVCEHLSGTSITQKPPMYSSVKVKGRKLYQYARAGIEVERPIRNIDIMKLSLTKNLHFFDGFWRADFIAGVSKGTYIRTLCVHIGDLLGVPAVMGNLTRVQVGQFMLKDSMKLDVIAEMVSIKDTKFILPIREAIVEQMVQIELDEDSYLKIRQGQKIENKFTVENQTIFAGIYHDNLVCILKNADGILRIIKNVGV